MRDREWVKKEIEKGSIKFVLFLMEKKWWSLGRKGNVEKFFRMMIVVYVSFILIYVAADVFVSLRSGTYT